MKSVNKAMNKLIENSKKETSEKRSITIRLGFEEYAVLKALASSTNKKPSALAKIIFSAALEDAKESYFDSCEHEEDKMSFGQLIGYETHQLGSSEELKDMHEKEASEMFERFCEYNAQ